jgi:nucleolar protein 58
LAEYLKNRMAAVAPNLTILIGELVAAKLIAHSGSLMNLAKQPASTIQILGAEKALFRALKTKKNTPKYGLIYNASLVGQAKANLKGKISRTLANKCALCVRYDALGENQDGKLGTDSRAFMEKRLKLLETGGQVIKAFGAGGNNQKKYEAKGDSKGYNQSNDFAGQEGAPYK